MNTRTINKKKDHIGKECLHLLLEFFVNESKNNGMRRWVGAMLSPAGPRLIGMTGRHFVPPAIGRLRREPFEG